MRRSISSRSRWVIAATVVLSSAAGRPAPLLSQPESGAQAPSPVHVASLAEERLAFDDAPLSTVAAQLERRYGLPIRIGDESLRNRRLTASFRDQPVAEVVAVVAASLGLDFVRVGSGYTFIPRRAVSAFALS
jgi:ferric-dicitrate binding protein FerR (iron transport regulator)